MYSGLPDHQASCLASANVTAACLPGALDEAVQEAATHAACCFMKKLGNSVRLFEMPSCCFDGVPHHYEDRSAFDRCHSSVMNAANFDENPKTHQYFTAFALVHKHCSDLRMLADNKRNNVLLAEALAGIKGLATKVSTLESEIRANHAAAMSEAVKLTGEAKNHATKLAAESTRIAGEHHAMAMSELTTANKNIDRNWQYAKRVNHTLNVTLSELKVQLVTLEEDAAYRQWVERHPSIWWLCYAVMFIDSWLFVAALFSESKRSINCLVQLALTITLQMGLFNQVPGKWRFEGWAGLALIAVLQLLAVAVFEFAARQRPTAFTGAVRDDMERNPHLYREAIRLIDQVPEPTSTTSASTFFILSKKKPAPAPGGAAKVEETSGFISSDLAFSALVVVGFAICVFVMIKGIFMRQL
jgi:hypothetical protein